MRLLVALALVPACGSSSQTSSSSPSAAAARATASVGQPAPDFELPDQDGRTHALSSLRGKVVVLEWTNPGCPFVQRHYDAGTMTRAQAALPAGRAVWLGVDSTSFHTADDSKTWRGERNIPWPILQDPGGSVGHAYGARTTPHMYVIDSEGVLRYAGGIDDDPHGEKEAPVNYAAQAAQALLSGNAPAVDHAETYGCSVKYAD